MNKRKPAKNRAEYVEQTFPPILEMLDKILHDDAFWQLEKDNQIAIFTIKYVIEKGLMFPMRYCDLTHDVDTLEYWFWHFCEKGKTCDECIIGDHENKSGHLCELKWSLLPIPQGNPEFDEPPEGVE